MKDESDFRLNWATFFIASVLALASAPARSGTVALTFHDLPVFGFFDSAADGALITDRLLGGCRRHHWKVTGVVNEIQIEGPDTPQRAALLEHRLHAGMGLGNTPIRTLRLNTSAVPAYLTDISGTKPKLVRS